MYVFVNMCLFYSMPACVSLIWIKFNWSNKIKIKKYVLK